jgi:hypothetical protein
LKNCTSFSIQFSDLQQIATVPWPSGKITICQGA